MPPMKVNLMTITGSLAATSFLLYSISTLHYLFLLVRGSDKVSRVGLYSARVGFLVNLLFILLTVSDRGSSVLFTVRGAFSLLAICVVTVFLYFTSRHRLSIIGPFMMPWAALFMGIALLSSGIPKTSFPVGLAGTIHILSAFMAYASFAFSALVSVIYLIFDRQLKRRKVSVFYHRVPSLPLMESIVYRTISIGFTFITLSMFAGAVWSQKLFGTYWAWHPKQVATLISWFIYASILHLYVTGKWKGKRICYLSLLGIALLTFDFVGVNLLSKDLHSF